MNSGGMTLKVVISYMYCKNIKANGEKFTCIKMKKAMTCNTEIVFNSCFIDTATKKFINSCEYRAMFKLVLIAEPMSVRATCKFSFLSICYGT